MESDEKEIDESLYSRQLYVLGDSAMKDLSGSSVLLCGLGGLGIEIAKNLVLMGVKHLAICDVETATESDLGLNFFLSTEDVALKRNRAVASHSHLRELNPYVKVDVLNVTPSDFEQFICAEMHKYQCLVLTGIIDLDVAIRLNSACRNQNLSIKFIFAGVYGIACWAFCDFGNEFIVSDADGEDPKEFIIGSIINGDPCIVNTADDMRHGLETGDKVLLRDIVGLDSLNEKEFAVSVVGPSSFAIGDSIEIVGDYQRGGFFKHVKQPLSVHFESLESQLKKPQYEIVDFGKELSPPTIHLALLALHCYLKEHGQLPNVRSVEDAKKLFRIVEDANTSLPSPAMKLDYGLLQQISFTARGHLAPLSSVIGGIVSQEVVKAVTRKFTPLRQWLFLDARELTTAEENPPMYLFEKRGDRYDALRACIGQRMLDVLSDVNLFMVGCGAIGCEMLKNYAMLGLARRHGKITITDNDLIEKSNLCRQFLFRMHHIRHPKSVVAAQAAHKINSEVNFEVHQNKVCEDTAHVYSDAFFGNNGVVVNALDNVESRRYMDRRCVQSGRPLLDSGTMGCKGHVQVIVPNCTENYSSQQDPVEVEYPFCTIKSFPSRTEHTVQWARDKFESLFVAKPRIVHKFQQTATSVGDLVCKLESGSPVEDSYVVAKQLEIRPRSFEDCVALARTKFEKYFNHKAKHLLYLFPLDTLMKGGTLFWQSPKRPPIPVEFDSQNNLHLSFVSSTARILCKVWNIPVSPEWVRKEFLLHVLRNVKVSAFVPNDRKYVETDISAKKPTEISSAENYDSQHLIRLLKNEDDRLLSVPICPQSFEKDDDTNFHIDFIHAAAGLRSSMYGLEPGTKLEVKRIAGSIIPAIASTTAAVAGMVSLELLKVVLGSTERSCFKNTFLNLALPSVVMSEPAPPIAHFLRHDVSFTVWDHWHIQGTPDMLLQDFLDQLQAKCLLRPTMVLEGTKIVWMPLLVGHSKKKAQRMSILLNEPKESQEYAELTVMYDGETEEIVGPTVRYYFKPRS